MAKIIEWLKDSHRYQHLIGGFIVGLGSTDVYCAAYTGVGVAGALEFKDKSYGNKWDWIDFGLTILGVAAGFGVKTLFKTYVL